jgi:hypothetical protein
LGLLSLLAVVPAGDMPRRLLTDPRPDDDEPAVTNEAGTPAPQTEAENEMPSEKPPTTSMA